MTRDPQSARQTVNGHRYADAPTKVMLNPQGLPVAFRIRSVEQAGAWGYMGVELVTPKDTTRVSMSTYSRLACWCTPLN
jgi:hypothetical protein